MESQLYSSGCNLWLLNMLGVVVVAQLIAAESRTLLWSVQGAVVGHMSASLCKADSCARVGLCLVTCAVREPWEGYNLTLTS